MRTIKLGCVNVVLLFQIYENIVKIIISLGII